MISVLAFLILRVARTIQEKEQRLVGPESGYCVREERHVYSSDSSFGELALERSKSVH
jgi:hypothetical protein